MAIVIIGALAVGFVVLLGNVLNYLQPVLVPLAVAGILAYLINPLVGKLEERGLTRLRAIVLVFAVFTVICTVATALVLPKVVEQAGQLIDKKSEHAEQIVRKLHGTSWLRPFLDRALTRHEKFTPPEPAPQPDSEKEPLADYYSWLNAYPDWVPGVLPEDYYANVPIEQSVAWVWAAETGKEVQWLAAGGKVLGFIGYALGFLLVPVYLFFFLKETATIKRRWGHFVPLKESNLKREVIDTLSEMNEYLIAFFRGQVLVSLINGALTGALLWMIDLPYAIVIGLALAILGVMPFIGFLVTLIPALIIAAAEWGDWQHLALVFAIFFVVQQIDALFIQPKVIGDKVGLHPMTIIFSIFFWSLILGGFLGALLAIPLTASVKVLFTRYIWDPATLDDENPDSGDVVPAENPGG